MHFSRMQGKSKRNADTIVVKAISQKQAMNPLTSARPISNLLNINNCQETEMPLQSYLITPFSTKLQGQLSHDSNKVSFTSNATQIPLSCKA